MKSPRTYGEIRLGDDGNWVLDAIEPHVSIRLKQIFPRIPRTARCPYHIRRTDGVDRDILWFMERYPLRALPDTILSMETGRRNYEALETEIERIRLPDFRPSNYPAIRDGMGLRNYQSQAVEIADRTGGLLVGDDCGLGKTFIGAGFCVDPKRWPVAVVCMLNIQRQWPSVLDAFTTLQTHRVTKATPYDLPPAQVYVFRYSQLAGWTDIFDTGFFKAVVFDEIQELRTGRASQKGCAAKVMAERANWRLGLSATPIMNLGSEIYNVMQYISPDVLGNHEDFINEWVSGDTGRAIMEFG